MVKNKNRGGGKKRMKGKEEGGGGREGRRGMEQVGTLSCTVCASAGV